MATEASDLAIKRLVGLIFINPTRAVAEMIALLKDSLRYDLSRMRPGLISLLQIAGYTAALVFYKISVLLLKKTKIFIERESVKDVISYEGAITANHYFVGTWDDIPEYNGLMVEDCEKAGLFWEIMFYSDFQAATQISRGKFREAELIAEEISVLKKKYQYITVAEHLLPAELFVAQRRPGRAYEKATMAISVSVEKGMEAYGLQAHGWGALAQLLMGNLVGAEAFLKQGKKIIAGRKYWPPFYLSSFLIAHLNLDLQRLRDAINGNPNPLTSGLSKQVSISEKNALKNCRKVAAYRSWIYRLTGEHRWLMGREKTALKWFDKSIREAKHLGARPDLARTYFEVGKRLLDPASKHKKLNRIDAEGYLEKARILFEEMGLERDLEDLDRITS